MIVVRLMGGIGNQLFQYAAGKALSLRCGTKLKLDTTFFSLEFERDVVKRHFELDNFNADINIASKNEIETFSKKKILSKVINKFLPPSFSKNYYADEKILRYDSKFNNYPVNTYLDGYWQSEKYFKNVRTILLKELTFKKQIPAVCLPIAEQIKNSVSVSLHVRRGDYISNQSASPNYSSLAIDYYNKALSIIKEKHPNSSIFVFSDDIPWVKANLNIMDTCTYVECNTGENSIFDLYLMSLCKHNIIANSSFSWWGAWLNQNKGKMVVAPKLWFAKDSLDSKDLIPESWIKI